MEMFNGFSENLKKKITSSPEWEKINKTYVKEAAGAIAKLAGPPVMEDESFDDIPF